MWESMSNPPSPEEVERGGEQGRQAVEGREGGRKVGLATYTHTSTVRPQKTQFRLLKERERARDRGDRSVVGGSDWVGLTLRYCRV